MRMLWYFKWCLWYSRWLLGRCCGIVVGCFGVARWLLVVAMTFYMVSRVVSFRWLLSVLCGCYEVAKGAQVMAMIFYYHAITRQLLWYQRWLACGCCDNLHG